MADIDRLLARGVISERAAQRMMTHFPEQPNPAQPVLDAVGRFARGGISGVIGHHDPVGDALQSEGANAALGVMTPLKGAALQRNVLARDPATRRPMRTERLPGTDDRILEKIGENNLRGPTDPDWKRMAATVRRESFEGDSYDLEFKAVRDAVAQGMPFRHAMLKHGSPSLLEAFEHVTKKDRGALGLGWPEELPFERPDEAVPESYYRSGPGVVKQPLVRNVLKSDARGRPMQTERLPIGNEQRVLERAEQRLGQGPRIVSRKEQEAILRKNWEEHGAEKDYDFDEFRTWDREVKLWNRRRPDNPMPEGDYKFGSNPEFEKMFDEKHLAGRRQPYPGAQRANEYFEDERPDLTAYTSMRQFPDDLRPSKMQK